jgi:hypothetical protein
MSDRRTVAIRLNESEIKKLDILAGGYGRAQVIARMINELYDKYPAGKEALKKQKSAEAFKERMAKIGVDCQDNIAAMDGSI